MTAKKPSPSKTSANSGKKAGTVKTSPVTPKKTVRKAAKGTAKAPSTSPQPKRVPRVIRQGLSLDRKLDIVGMVFVLVGLLTLLSLLSATNSEATGWWVTALTSAFGWGSYIFPFGMILLGLWLLLRSFKNIPQLAIERLAGIILLFLVGIAGIHLVQMIMTGATAIELAEAGQGGGYTGALISGVLQAALGIGGAAIALAALALIGLALALDVTIVEMAHALRERYMHFLDWLGDAIDDLQNRRSGRGASQSAPPGEHPPGPLMPSASLAATSSEAVVIHTGVRDPHAPPNPVWVLPPLEEIMEPGSEPDFDDDTDAERAKVIEDTLASFGAPARVVEINRGPTITQFGVEPDFIESRNGRMRVRVSKITSLADDLALALSARTIRVQAPVPGKGFVGIEVPNEHVALVAVRDLLENEVLKKMKAPLRFALGQNVAGNAVAADLAAMPHLLIAGATGSGKSVCVNALICCLLLNNTPDDLRLVMVDPKRVELTGYNGIPHLLSPVVVETEKVVTVLQWVTREMDMRYRKLAEAGCRNIQEYNARITAQGGKKLPFLVVMIDELADLMILAPEETERTITRLAQLARATGIHLVIATQRPSVDVVTGLIKANFPARIAFAVASGVDSRTILDQPGAERLLGRGDMLFQAPDAPAPVRLQGVFVSDTEIAQLVNYWRGQAGTAQPGETAIGGVVDASLSGTPLKQIPLWDEMADEEEAGDPLLNEAVDLSRRQGRASISMLQRRMRIGYTRAARLVETMEAKGIVGPPEPGTGTRPILDYGSAAPPVDE